MRSKKGEVKNFGIPTWKNKILIKVIKKSACEMNLMSTKETVPTLLRRH